jgi:hypothetical protein
VKRNLHMCCTPLPPRTKLNVCREPTGPRRLPSPNRPRRPRTSNLRRRPSPASQPATPANHRAFDAHITRLTTGHAGLEPGGDATKPRRGRAGVCFVFGSGWPGRLSRARTAPSSSGASRPLRERAGLGGARSLERPRSARPGPRPAAGGHNPDDGSLFPGGVDGIIPLRADTWSHCFTRFAASDSKRCDYTTYAIS